MLVPSVLVELRGLLPEAASVSAVDVSIKPLPSTLPTVRGMVALGTGREIDTAPQVAGVTCEQYIVTVHRTCKQTFRCSCAASYKLSLCSNSRGREWNRLNQCPGCGVFIQKDWITRIGQRACTVTNPINDQVARRESSRRRLAPMSITAHERVINTKKLRYRFDKRKIRRTCGGCGNNKNNRCKYAYKSNSNDGETTIV